MMNGETIMTGAAQVCEDCGETPDLQVCFSGGGHYLGTYCSCGPYSRESDYFRSRKDAEAALADWKRGRLTAVRG